MAKAETASTTTRSPRGAKPVSQAFFTALESVPEATRAAVAKAAQAMIRDEIKMQREKARAAAAKEKARKPVAAKTAKTAKPAKTATAAKKPAAVKSKAATPAKRRPRKTADLPAAA